MHVVPLRQRPAFAALTAHHARVRDLSLRALFAGDPARAARLAFDVAGLHVDFSKHRATAETVDLLVRLAHESGVPARIEAMFRGDRINTTEGRSVLHVALRAPRGTRLVVDGEDVVEKVHAVLDRMAAFSERVRSGAWTGHTGKRIRAVVNVGIGGSDLGPAMAWEALRPFTDRSVAFRFVSNVDGTDLVEALRDLDPAETLFVVVSKTFSTVETMTNAASARAWLLAGLGGDARAVARHFVAVSTDLARVRAFGIDPEATFGFWDWVGGRYSMTSAVGLSTMLAVGPDRFRELLDGFHAMDEHLRTAPLERNLPVLKALLGVWYAQWFGAAACAVLPYDQALRRLPAYLQQLAMESNGKRVRLDGTVVDHPTSPVWFGEPGTNGQHSFFQLLHQGTPFVPADFVVCAHPSHGLRAHHDLLVANALAQAEALAFGRTEAEVRAEGTPDALVPHRVFPGDRPTTTIVLDRLTPAALGALVALYEHQVLVEGVVWGVDSFDQWGVELGKVLATRLRDELTADGEPARGRHDASTEALLRRLRAARRAAGGAG
ncbi:MAG: glucose-6-phosphate isomerase [Planctomycetes bacterium]|nr:glucose-6-phosphate isomerase [Planctomycetota bacterium]